MSLDPLPQMEPSIDEAEVEQMCRYLRSGAWLTEFKKTQEFEEALCAATGALYACAVNNGTVSLMLALKALGIGPGDEVLVPALTMIATANAVRLAGAEPVFCDIEAGSACLDIEEIERRQTERTRAVIHVSLNGRAREMKALSQLCQDRGLELIEDAAQSLGSQHKGRALGRFGSIGSLSFSAPKIITTGQGGALITDDAELYAKLRRLKDFGRDRGGHDHHEELGWNFKFSDLQAVIGIEQMKKLPGRIATKKELWRCYRRNLEGIPGISFFDDDEETLPWFFDVYTEDRDGLREHLSRRGIGTRPLYPALNTQPIYRGAGSYPVAEELARRGLWLPSSSLLRVEDVQRVCRGIREWSESQSSTPRPVAFSHPLP